MTVVVAGVLVVVDVVVALDELALKVRLTRIDPGVEHGDDNLRRAGCQIPGLLRPGLLDRPLAGQELVIRDPKRPDGPVELRVAHLRLRTQEREGVSRVGRVQTQNVGPQRLEPSKPLRTESALEVVGAREAPLRVADDDPRTGRCRRAAARREQEEHAGGERRYARAEHRDERGAAATRVLAVDRNLLRPGGPREAHQQ